MNSSQTVKGRFWLLHHLRINQLRIDIIYLRPLIILLLLVQASFASEHELINFETMKGSFKQSYKENKDGSNNFSKGYLVIKRPDLMLWHIKEPTERIIMFQEGLMSVFDPDLNQVIKTEIDQVEDANWIKIMMGEGELIEKYQQHIDEYDSYTLIKYQSLHDDLLRHVITIKIKEESIEYINIDLLGNEMIQITIKDIEINQKIDDEFFNGFIPSNAEIIQ